MEAPDWSFTVPSMEPALPNCARLGAAHNRKAKLNTMTLAAVMWPKNKLHNFFIIFFSDPLREVSVERVRSPGRAAAAPGERNEGTEVRIVQREGGARE